MDGGTFDFNSPGSHNLTNGVLNFGISNLTSFGSVFLNGAANLASMAATFYGYVPAVGNSWQVLTYGSSTGNFTATNLPPVAVWQVGQNNTALSIQVLKLVPQITWGEPADITYAAALTGAQLDATAMWNGSPVSGTFVYSPPLGAVLQSGSNQVLSATFNPTDLTTYTNVTTIVLINVQKASLSVTATNITKSYGQTTSFAGTEFISSGLVNGDTIASATISSLGAPPTAPVSGSPYTIAITNAVGDACFTNYNITYTTGSLTVNTAPLAITASAEDKTYGQTVIFGSGSMLFGSVGLQNGESIGSVTLAVTGGGGVAIAPVNTYTITPSAATGGTFDTNNYSLSYYSGILTVNPAPLTITANAQSKTYGANLTFGGGSALFTSTTLSNNDSVSSVTLACAGGVTTAPVNTYTITPSAATGSGLANYSISYVTNQLTVNQAPLTVTASAQSKTYGANLTFGGGSALFTSTTLSNNDSVSSVTLTCAGGVTTAPVNTYTITPSAAVGSGLANYSINYVTANLTVNQAPLTVTANAQSKTYGANLTFGSGSTLFTSTTLSNNDSVSSVTLTCSGGVPTTPVGNYTITPSAATGSGLANYSISYVTNLLTVNQAPLTVTANAQSKTYGANLSFGGGSALFTSTTLSNSDSVSSVTLTCSGGAPTAPVNTYTITPSAATGSGLANYSISYVTNQLTVGQAPLTVTANAQSKTYGANLTFGSGSTLFTSTTLSNSDSISSVTLACSGGVPTAPVNTYTITPSAATGSGLANYSISYVTNQLTVGQAQLTVTANAQSKTYGANLTFGGGSTLFASTTLSNSDSISSVTLTCAGGVPTAPVNTYTITPSAAVGSGLANYSIDYVTANLTVGQAPLTVTANAQSKTYGANLTFGGGSALFTSTTLSNSDSISSVTLTCSGGAPTAPVNTYTITPSAAIGSGLANYSISYLTNQLTVNPAPLTITADNTNKILGQTVTFSGKEFMAGGLQNSETVGSVTLTSAGGRRTPPRLLRHCAKRFARAGLSRKPIIPTHSSRKGTLVVSGLPDLVITRSGANYVLTFSTVTNESYQIQSVTNLSLPTWPAFGGSIKRDGRIHQRHQPTSGRTNLLPFGNHALSGLCFVALNEYSLLICVSPDIATTSTTENNVRAGHAAQRLQFYLITRARLSANPISARPDSPPSQRFLRRAASPHYFDWPPDQCCGARHRDRPRWFVRL